MKIGTRLSNVITKCAETGTVTYTAGGTVTSSGTAFAVGVTKPYTAMKVLFPFIKAGSAAVDVQIEVQSDTGTGSAYQSITNTDGLTVTAVGTDADHGHIATTGMGVAEANYDLTQVKVGTNLKIKLTCTFTAGSVDTVIGLPLFQFAGGRREPPTGTVVNTIA